METYFKDGIEYYKSNRRMVFNPEFHDKHNMKWDKEEIAYLVQMRPSMRYKDISMALGKTENTCMSKYHSIKKRGLIEYYRKIEI